MSYIVVDYRVHSNTYNIRNALLELKHQPILAFDTETAGLYSKAERKEAEKWIQNHTDPDAALIAANSGLSFPSLTKTTHFVFGTSRSTSEIIICQNQVEEMMCWKWLRSFPGKLAIHNTLFDLKSMFHRVGELPADYEDTALMAKTLINNADTWKAKVGLKNLMAEHYDPKWTLIDEYEPENLKDEKFLRYAAIDGAATFYLYELLMETLNEKHELPEV